jgi:hypothetical protein
MQPFIVKMSQQQQDELHAQTSEHDGCESVRETKRRKKAEYNRLYRLRNKLENNDECFIFFNFAISIPHHYIAIPTKLKKSCKF